MLPYLEICTDSRLYFTILQRFIENTDYHLELLCRENVVMEMNKCSCCLDQLRKG